MSAVAPFVSLGGHRLRRRRDDHLARDPNNTIQSKDIKNESIQSEDIDVSELDANTIDSAAIRSAEIQNGSILLKDIGLCPRLRLPVREPVGQHDVGLRLGSAMCLRRPGRDR